MRGVDSARHFQFTVASIGQIFVNLARIAGIPDYDPKVAPRRLARLLQLGSIGDNGKRVAKSSFLMPVPAAQFRKAGTRKAMGHLKSSAIAVADAVFTGEYKEALRLAHLEMPKTVPAGHAETFKAKWGLDIAARLGLRACGLSSAACMSPACPHFMLPMDTPVYVQPTASGGTRIGCRLWLHLQPLQVIPGLHKSVQRIIDEERMTEGQVAVDSVLGGADLVKCAPSAGKRHEEYVQALAQLRKKAKLTPGRLAELERIVMENFDRSSGAALREYVKRLEERVDEALTARGLRQVHQREDYVARRVLDIGMKRNAWDYGDFEAAVLASPLVRSQTDGRFAVVARP